jgi:ABC-type enterochelin transport system permease subunit
VQVSAATAGSRIPLVVIGILLGLVVLTVVTGFALHADGVRHAGTWAAMVAAAVVGFGGPEILRVTRRWAHA